MTRCLAVAAFVAGLSLAAASEADAQCAMCRTALEESEQGQAMAEKFNKGILFLLGAPFGVAGGIGFAMVRSQKRRAV